MNPHRRSRLASIAFAALTASVFGQGTPVGFEETYALAPDRAKAVATLIPGTEECYYYACRERLDAGDFAAVRKILPAWIQRHGRTPRVIEIENREALLSFAAGPATDVRVPARAPGAHLRPPAGRARREERSADAARPGRSRPTRR